MYIEIEVIFRINVGPLECLNHSTMDPSDSSLLGGLSRYYRFYCNRITFSCSVKIVINILSRHESFKR